MPTLDKCLLLLSSCIFALMIPACGDNEPLFRELQAKASDITLHVRVAGDPKSGDVLIAINGGPGLSSHYMVDLERLAGPEFAVVTYDQRGVGRSSSVPLEPSAFELLDYVGDLEAVRAAVGVEKVHLLGHSWGGIVAMRYATVYPEKVRSLVFIGGGPPNWGPVQEANRLFSERVAELQRRGLIPMDLTGDFKEDPTLPAYFSDPTFKFSPDEGEPPYYNQAVNAMTLSVNEGYDIRAEVAELKQRVLILWGEDDPFGWQIPEATRQAFSNAEVEYVVLTKCGHFWHECPDQFYGRVRAFLGLPTEP